MLADTPSSVERLSSNPGERPGRGAVLALFIAVVFLAGVFLGASLSGPPAIKTGSPLAKPAAPPLAAERQDAGSPAAPKLAPALLRPKARALFHRQRPLLVRHHRYRRPLQRRRHPLRSRRRPPLRRRQRRYLRIRQAHLRRDLPNRR